MSGPVMSDVRTYYALPKARFYEHLTAHELVAILRAQGKSDEHILRCSVDAMDFRRAQPEDLVPETQWLQETIEAHAQNQIGDHFELTITEAQDAQLRELLAKWISDCGFSKRWIIQVSPERRRRFTREDLKAGLA